MHFVEIADWVLVEDDDVCAQALEAPVLLRLQHLAHEVEIVAHDADEEDGQVAGDAVRPEAPLSERIAGEDLRGCPQRAVAVEDAGREALEQLKAIDPTVNGIVVSGYAQDSVITDYREHGFKAVIAKPFTLQELSWTLESVVPTTSRWLH